MKNNLIYIGNILALREWYRNVRSHFLRDRFDLALVDGGVTNLDLILNERIKRLGELAGKLEHSTERLEDQNGSSDELDVQKRFRTEWSGIEPVLLKDEPSQDEEMMTRFIDRLPASKDYVETIQLLKPDLRDAGCGWMQSIVDGIEQLWSN